MAKKRSEKLIGMNIFSRPPKRTGMIFLYDKEEENRTFTLRKTPFPLLVIFLDEKNNIVYKEFAKAKQSKPIICKKPSKRVIEIPV